MYSFTAEIVRSRFRSAYKVSRVASINVSLSSEVLQPAEYSPAVTMTHELLELCGGDKAIDIKVFQELLLFLGNV
jgi:hypothetical protein